MEQRYVESPDKKIYATGTSNRKPHERIRMAHMPVNIARVSELICTQDDDPSTSKSPREIQSETGISRSTVRRIVKDDSKLKIFRRREVQQLSNSDAKKLLQTCMRLMQRTTVDKIERTWFSDKKIFTDITRSIPLSSPDGLASASELIHLPYP